MLIAVPFIYEAMIVQPKKRKPTVVAVKDSVVVEIREITDFPVAIKIGTTSLRWDGHNLWDCSTTNIANKPRLKVAASTIKEITESSGEKYPYSGTSPMAPFHNFWYYHDDTMFVRHNIKMGAMKKWLKDDDVLTREQIVFREWVDDNRESVIAHAQEIANNMLIHNGLVFTPVGEPRYVIMTYGLGGNHASTDLSVDMSYNSNIGSERYYSALQYQEACEAADKVAKNRGDTKSIPVRPQEKIEVLIPESIKLNPSRDHGKGNDFINSIEAGINAGGSVGGVLAAMTGILSHK